MGTHSFRHPFRRGCSGHCRPPHQVNAGETGISSENGLFTGFDRIGQRGLAIVAYLLTMAVGFPALVWLLVAPSFPALCVVSGAVLLTLVRWVGEQIAVRRLPLRPPRPTFLVRGFTVTAATG